MEKKTLDYSVKDLVDLVRSTQVWKGALAKTSIRKDLSAQLWLEEEKITSGIFKNRAMNVYNTYREWCVNRKLNEDSIMSLTAFGEYLKKILPNSKKRNVTFYHLNKPLSNDEKEIDQKNSAKSKTHTKKDPKK